MTKLLMAIFMVLLAGCSGQQKVVNTHTAMANEPFIIYKTKANYNHLVPVLLNEPKTRIVAYPAPSDLKVDGDLRLPTQLSNGYLLDNKGIGKNVAFTSYTYKEYAARNEAPGIEELMNHIVDNDPLLELYDCKDYINLKHDLKKVNRLVKTDLKSCVKVK